MFIVALFIAAKNLEQPMCSSTDGLNFKLIVVYLYNEIKLSNKKEWVIDTYNMNFKNIMLKKILTPNNTECMIPFIRNSRTGKSYPRGKKSEQWLLEGRERQGLTGK